MIGHLNSSADQGGFFWHGFSICLTFLRVGLFLFFSLLAYLVQDLQFFDQLVSISPPRNKIMVQT